MRPVFADFSCDPPRVGNAQVRIDDSFAAGDHLAINAGGTVEIAFEVPPEGVAGEATLEIRALVSKLELQPGHAPMRVLVNEHRLLKAHRTPGGGDLPQRTRVAVPAGHLRPGTNTLTIRSSPRAHSFLWLYQVLLEAVYDRGAAARAAMADVMREPVLTFDTRRRAAESEAWISGPRLRVYIDSGEGAPLAQLAWRGGDGSEASVVLTADLNSVHGHLRDADGGWHELRGTLVTRQAYPGGVAGASVLRFTTESHWGGFWHPAGPLTVVLDVGGGPLDRVSWRDQRECSASIGLVAGGASFLGWAQRVEEGSIGYRGKADG